MKLARKLIAGLGNKGVEVKHSYETDAPYVVIPKDFDWKSHAKVNDRVEKLIELGMDAFPELIHAPNGDLFCGFYDTGVVEKPETVWRLCEKIIVCQVEVFDFEIAGQSQLSWIPHVLRGDGWRNNGVDWDKWWKKNKGKSLRKLQIEAAEEAIAILEKTKDDREDFKEWRAKQIKGLKKMIAKLEKSKKPMPPSHPPHVRLVRQECVKKVGNQERYYYENGK